jgi:hypothetical protein
MNPICIDDKRPFVWMVSRDKSEVAKGNAYCIYLHGNLHVENLNVEDFLKLYDELSPLSHTNKQAA